VNSGCRNRGSLPVVSLGQRPLLAKVGARGGDTRLLTEWEYKGSLDKIELELPKWEAALKPDALEIA
jgi:hypothetical protein